MNPVPLLNGCDLCLSRPSKSGLRRVSRFLHPATRGAASPMGACESRPWDSRLPGLAGVLTGSDARCAGAREGAGGMDASPSVP